MGIIYKYTSPSGKNYIGQTTKTLYERASDSYGHGYKECPAFYNAIVKYNGLQNFLVEILEEVPNEELNDREKYYIKYFNSVVPFGYNLTLGGNQNYIYSQKAVDQFDLKGNLIKTYDSLTQAAEENNFSISSLSQVCDGKKITLKGFKWSYHGEEPSNKTPKKKIVYCFLDNGQLLKEFESCQNAANYYNVPFHQIQQCASKNRRKRVNEDLIFTYEPFIDWEYYTLKHKKPNSTTICDKVD